MKLPRRLKVVEKRLGREKASGVVYEGDRDTLHIDPTLRSQDRCEILLHEALHLLDPAMPEMKVRAWSRRLSDLLWRDRWRRMED